MVEKTKQFLAYIAKNYIPATVTSLMKLAYLIDLVSVTKKEGQISNFTYRRYKYGPFDSKIYDYLTELVNQKVLKEETEYTPTAEEYIKYKFNEEIEDIKFDNLNKKEMDSINEVLESLKGYGAKTLTEITYKTKPMLVLGATLGGEENLNTILDLKTQ